jgi:toxin ParE1/3/4
MKVVYSPRAIADLEHIAAYYRAVASPSVAAAVAERIERGIARVADQPRIGQMVDERPGVRALVIRNAPYKVFYRLRDGSVEIAHIRHTARRPWMGTQ